MFELNVRTDDRTILWADILAAADGLTAGEPDLIANMANVAALLFTSLPDVNWAGFYRAIDGELVLGPFGGKPACIRIAWGQGVCGAAAASGEIRRVEDVHAFPGHIACDPASRSELVVPLFAADGAVWGVLDLDSPRPARFDEADAAGCAALARLLEGRLAGAKAR